MAFRGHTQAGELVRAEIVICTVVMAGRFKAPQTRDVAQRQRAERWEVRHACPESRAACIVFKVCSRGRCRGNPFRESCCDPFAS
jgi:hypothetical protein